MHPRSPRARPCRTVPHEQGGSLPRVMPARGTAGGLDICMVVPSLRSATPAIVASRWHQDARLAARCVATIWYNALFNLRLD